MKELIQAVGVLIRFPFFIVGLAFITFLGTPLMLLLFAFHVVAIPWVFIMAAYENKPDDFTDHMKELLPIVDLKDAYSGAWRWLQKG